jgi:aminomethyltransferase
MSELRVTPLHAEHLRLAARMVPFAGYQMPVQYKGIVAEHTAVRERAGVFDVSHMGELWLTGPGAVAAVDALVTNDIGDLPDGKAAYTVCCNEGGTILDDLIVYKYGPERVLVVCNASNRDKIAAHFGERTRGRCTFEDASDRTALIALQGPKALEVLKAAGCELDGGPESMPSFAVRDTIVAGRPVHLARTGYTGEDGVEIFTSDLDATTIWAALLDAGAASGIEAIGLGARDTLRLEARLALYGNDIDETTNPIEAGLGWVVKFGKGDFVGKGALEKVKAAGPPRKLVGFEMTGRGSARHGYPLKSLAGAEVGICTSGAPSPTLGKSIGLGYLPADMAALGTEFAVDCRGRDVSAKVVPTPFYRRRRPS